MRMFHKKQNELRGNLNYKPLQWFLIITFDLAHIKFIFHRSQHGKAPLCGYTSFINGTTEHSFLNSAERKTQPLSQVCPTAHHEKLSSSLSLLHTFSLFWWLSCLIWMLSVTVWLDTLLYPASGCPHANSCQLGLLSDQAQISTPIVLSELGYNVSSLYLIIRLDRADVLCL